MARLGGVQRMQQRQALGEIGSGLEITVGGDHLEREREWVRQMGVMKQRCERREKKNIKENLAFVLNLEWYCSSMTNFLACRTFYVSDILVLYLAFGTPDDNSLMLLFIILIVLLLK